MCKKKKGLKFFVCFVIWPPCEPMETHAKKKICASLNSSKQSAKPILFLHSILFFNNREPQTIALKIFSNQVSLFYTKTTGQTIYSSFHFIPNPSTEKERKKTAFTSLIWKDFLHTSKRQPVSEGNWEREIERGRRRRRKPRELAWLCCVWPKVEAHLR